MYNTVRIKPPKELKIKVKLPGSKSITNRALVCASLADGKSVIKNASFSDDTKYLIEALAKMGVRIVQDRNEKQIEVYGGRFSPPVSETFFMGNAGTSLRFLVSFLSLYKGFFTVDGEQRMRERPIGKLVDSLNSLGGEIKYLMKEGCPPVSIAAKGLAGGKVKFDSYESSQFISSLFMVAPYTDQGVQIDLTSKGGSRGYIDMTLDVMKKFGIDSKDRFDQKPGKYSPIVYTVEPDFSLANYFLAMPAVREGFVEVEGLDESSIHPEKKFLHVLELMGLKISTTNGKIRVESNQTIGVDVDISEIPDSAQTLGFISLFAKDSTTLGNVEGLRLKETDRVVALATELTRLGATVEAVRLAVRITPPAKVAPATIETYNDHRMVMSAVLAAMANEDVVIKNPSCVSKSFPEFFNTLEECGFEVHFN